MPGWFITALICAGIGLIAVVAAMVMGNEDRSIARLVAVGMIGLAALFTVVSSANVVSTKNVGIVTVFGKPSGNLSNGLHFVAPWAKVSELSAAIQTDSRTRSPEDAGDCVWVRIARQAQACVDNSVRWRIRQEASDGLFQDFRDLDAIRDSLVVRELNATLNRVFESYDPLGINDEGISTTPNVNDLSQQATDQMEEKVGERVEILSVIIGNVYLDDNTQKRVDEQQAQVIKTRIADQASLTADKQAAANNKLAESLRDPNVLVSRCYDLVNDMIGKGISLPPAFSCWPGSSSSVVLPAVPATK